MRANQVPAAVGKPRGKQIPAPGNREAPIGHRQPRAKDVPPRNEDNLGVRSPEDQAVDRKLRICRDC
jgi:hypothetical protein